MSGGGDNAPDRIVLQGMEFHAHHGVHPEEASLGARFSVDVELGLRLGGSDSLAETVDYSAVYALVTRTVTGTRHQLIESLATGLAEQVLAGFPSVLNVTVRVHKPHAPLPGVFRDVFVEIKRGR